MKRIFISLARSDSGSAAAEMALTAPLLIALMFGSFELGNYFLNEHAVVKAVRDGARYAARLPIENYSCPTGATTGSITGGSTDIQNVTRTGSLDGSASPRLGYWTDNNTITISVSCASSSTYTGIYRGIPGDVPVVKVKAAVTYPMLFGRAGLPIASLTLNAEAQEPVMGI